MIEGWFVEADDNFAIDVDNWNSALPRFSNGFYGSVRVIIDITIGILEALFSQIVLGHVAGAAPFGTINRNGRSITHTSSLACF